MNDVDHRLTELRVATAELKAPEGFEGRLALALVAAPASAALTVLGLKFKTLLALLVGAGVVAGGVAVGLDRDLPTPSGEQRPVSSTTAVSPPAGPVAAAAPEHALSPLEVPLTQRPPLPPPEPSEPSLNPSGAGATTSASAAPPAAPPQRPVLDLSLQPPPVPHWPAPGCERSRASAVLEPKEPLDVALQRRPFPVSLRALLALPHGPLVVGRLQPSTDNADAGGQAFGTEVTVLERGWFYVPRRALPAWVVKNGFDPLKLEASEALPSDASSFVGEVTLVRHLVQRDELTLFQVRGDVAKAHAMIEVAALPCGADRNATPHPIGRLELTPWDSRGAHAQMVGLAPAPYLATLRGEGLLEERVVFEPEKVSVVTSFTIEPLVDFDAEYLVVSNATVSGSPHTLEHVSANAPFFVGTQHPLQLSQRAGVVSFATSGTDWRGADTERTGRLVDAKVTLSGLRPLTGVVQPGHLYLLQDGPTFALVRFTLRP